MNAVLRMNPGEIARAQAQPKWPDSAHRANDDTGDALDTSFGEAVGDRVNVWVEDVYAGRLHGRDADVDVSYDPFHRWALTPALSESIRRYRTAKRNPKMAHATESVAKSN